MSARFLLEQYKSFGIEVPSAHFVLGSGISQALKAELFRNDFDLKGEIAFKNISGLNLATVSGHPGLLKYFQHRKTKKSFCFQLGRLHGYEGIDSREVIKPVLYAKLAGCKTFILTNASGSLKKQFRPGSIMHIKDQVNLTGKNPLIGENPKDESGTPIGPRFPDMGEIYDSKMSKALDKFLLKNRIKTHQGIYLGLMGPSYETPAEVALFSKWGLGAVGMSTVWEAIALKHAGAKVAGLSLISNFGCGLSGSQPLKHEDVEKIAGQVAAKLLKSLFEYSSYYAENL